MHDEPFNLSTDYRHKRKKEPVCTTNPNTLQKKLIDDFDWEANQTSLLEPAMPKMPEPQRQQVEALREPQTTLYKNKKGDILLATPHQHGLWRCMVRKDGSYEPLFSGPVDESKWTPA